MALLGGLTGIYGLENLSTFGTGYSIGHSYSLRGLSQILVDPVGRKIPKEEEGAEARADLGTLGKAAGSQDIAKGPAMNTNRSLIKPILSGTVIPWVSHLPDP